MREIRTEIDIDASPSTVWEILTDFSAFPEWNPFMRTIEGELVAGGRIRVVLQPPGRRAMTFRPTLVTVRSGRGFSWLGRLGMPGIFDGEHVHEVRPLGPDRTRYVQSERFRGLLVPFTGGTLEGVRRGFDEMNRALKARAEAAVGISPRAA
jgi:hypothetical protein